MARILAISATLCLISSSACKIETTLKNIATFSTFLFRLPPKKEKERKERKREERKGKERKLIAH